MLLPMDVLVSTLGQSATLLCVAPRSNVTWLIDAEVVTVNTPNVSVGRIGNRELPYLMFESFSEELNGTMIRCVKNQTSSSPTMIILQG